MAVKYGDRFVSVDSDDGATRLVISTEPLDLGAVVVLDRHCRIEADVIHVNENVLLRGKDLILRCRELRIVDGASIVSEGAVGEPDYPPGKPPVNSANQNPGDNGADGNPGGPGGQSGSIDIACERLLGRAVIRVQGGRGGRGQDGGNGMQGGQGPAGRRIEIAEGSRAVDPIEVKGGTGLEGGAVGLPGKNGQGGQAGRIDVRVHSIGACEAALERKAGEFGPNALPGQPGPGGPGGAPGALYRVDWEILGTAPDLYVEQREAMEAMPSTEALFRLERNRSSHVLAVVAEGLLRSRFDHDIGKPRRVVKLEFNGAPGDQGPTGKTRDAEVRANQLHVDTESQRVEATGIPLAELGASFSDAFLSMQLERMEDDFRILGLGKDDAFWSKVQTYLEMCRGKPELFSRLCAMVQKSLLGLDYFGYAIDSAPLLSMSLYKDLIEQSVLPMARFLDVQYREYVRELKTDDERLELLVAAKDRAQAQLIALSAQREELDKTAENLLQSLPLTNQAVADARIVLLKAASELKAAYAAQGGCDVVNTVVTAGVIVAGVYATGGAALAGAASWSGFIDSWNANNASASKLWDAKQVLGDGLKKVGGDIGDVSNGINAIRQGYEKLNERQKELNLPSLAMERAEFDKIADSYAGLSQAEDYKQAGYAYLDRVEARNKTIVEYNSKLLQMLDLNQQERAAQEMADSAASVVAGTIDVANPLLMARLRALRKSVLDGAAALIHAQSKAMGYLLAEYAAPSISSRNAEELQAAHLKVLQRWTTVKEAYKPVKRLLPGAVSVPLRRFATAADWKRFVQAERGRDKVLLLNINIRALSQGDILRTAKALRVTGASLALVGTSLKESQNVQWVMLQDGRETLLKSETESISFIRPPSHLTGYVSAKPVDDPDTSEGGLYSGKSLLATWTLVLKDKEDLIQYQSLDDLALQIEGYYLG